MAMALLVCAVACTATPVERVTLAPSVEAPVKSSGPTATVASPSPGVHAGYFANPVIAGDFPDPFVLRVGDTYYAYATTDGAQHLQLARSTDLVTWQTLGDPLPSLAGWSSGDTWAPEVLQTRAGFVLYYTSRAPAFKRPDGDGSQCISSGLAAHPQGPFVDRSSEPLVCQSSLGGSIDATPFVDANGRTYLIWKNDGNCCGLPTRFYIQELSDDGLRLRGKATDLGVVNDRPWEGGAIEAPTLILKAGIYYLIYSANAYDTDSYAVGYATSRKVLGPYTDAPENPVLASAWGRLVGSRARGPGHQAIVSAKDGQLWIVYHAWDKDAVGYQNSGRRSLWIDRLDLQAGTATVRGPTGDPQPVP